MKRFLRSALAAVAVVSSTAEGEEAPRLSRGDVELVLAQAVTKAGSIDPNAIVAVTDREGFLLGLWDVSGRQPAVLPPFSLTVSNTLKVYSRVAGAITRASTAAFLSSNGEAFTSRTAGYIIQQHFPVGVRNTPNGPLVGVGFSSLFFSDVNRVKLIPPGFDGAAALADTTVSPGVRAPAFPLTSLNDSPGGVPLYKGGVLVGGVGVTGDGSPTDLTPAGAIFFNEVNRLGTTGFKTGKDADEEVALAGQTGFRPPSLILASNVLIGGVRIPYVYAREEDIEDVRDVETLGKQGHAIDVPLTRAVASGMPQASPEPYPYEGRSIHGVEGLVRFPFRNDPLLGDARRGLIGRAGRLTVREVEEIIGNAAERASKTRAGIRLPIGKSAEVFISVVGNPNLAGAPPPILGVFQTNGEATIFSWDVAVQKARTALFFSNRQLAMSSRSVGFLSQRFYPPGIDGRPWGPFFGFQEAVSLRQRPLRDQAAGAPAFPGNPNLPNGETIFPGGFPLYRDGFVIGAIGVSGDGVDQDDIIAASGCEGFLPDGKIRADTYAYRGARLPYAKFPRDPVQ